MKTIGTSLKNIFRANLKTIFRTLLFKVLAAVVSLVVGFGVASFVVVSMRSNAPAAHTLTSPQDALPALAAGPDGSASPSATPCTPSASAAARPSPSKSPSPSARPSQSASPSARPSPTSSPSATPRATPTSSPSATPRSSPSATASPCPSAKPASKPKVISDPKVTEKPPPVVDGVRRANVAAAHSPELDQQLSGGPAVLPTSEAGAVGIDVADYQHPNGAAINWGEVAGAGYRFAFIKATEANYYVNPYFASDIQAAKAAGLLATGYVFAVPNVSSGASQADYANANGHFATNGHTLPLALDIEYNPYKGGTCYGLSASAMVSWLSSFVAEARKDTGQLPVIYTTADWWKTCTGNSTKFTADPLWIAGWDSGAPAMPAGWKSWTFWQFSDNGTSPGITGKVDVSFFLTGAVHLLNPGSQSSAAGTAVKLQVGSVATNSGSLSFKATGLPAGLSISASGLISGTIAASATGSHSVTVTAASGSGTSASVSFAWTVTAKASPAPTTAPPTTAPPTTAPPTTPPATSPPTSTSPPSTTPPASPSPSPSPTPSPSPSDSSPATDGTTTDGSSGTDADTPASSSPDSTAQPATAPDTTSPPDTSSAAPAAQAPAPDAPAQPADTGESAGAPAPADPAAPSASG